MNQDQTPTKPTMTPADKPTIAPVVQAPARAQTQAPAQTPAAVRVEPQGTPITAPAVKA
jgi:hypothetical protein